MCVFSPIHDACRRLATFVSLCAFVCMCATVRCSLVTNCLGMRTDWCVGTKIDECERPFFDGD